MTSIRRHSQWMRLGTLGFFVGVLAFSSPAARGQEERPPRGPLPEPIEVQKIEPKKEKDGTWSLTISGRKSRALAMPTGTKLSFTLRWRFRDVSHFQVVLTGRPQFKEKILRTHIDGFVSGLWLRARIVYEQQPESVRKFIDEHPDAFPTGRGEKPGSRGPWVYPFRKPPIVIGTPEDLKKQEAGVQAFFKEQLVALVQADRKFSAERKRVLAGEAFQRSGKFDPEAWQKWVEKEVRDPIRACQRRIIEARDGVRFLAHLRDLETYLLSLSRAVAKRTYERSKSMYEKLGVAADPRDMAPRKIDASARRFRSKDLKAWVERICESQGIPLDQVM